MDCREQKNQTKAISPQELLLLLTSIALIYLILFFYTYTFYIHITYTVCKLSLNTGLND